MENLENCENPVSSAPAENSWAQPYRSSMDNPGFFQRIVESFLSPKDLTENIGEHKFCCHKENAKKVRVQLEEIKTELEREADEELFSMIVEVINPMLRDVDRIDRLMKKTKGEGDASEQFQEWTQGAKLWVELYSKNLKDKQTIKSAIVKHIKDKTMMRIEKDIRFIEEYLEQSIKEKNFSSEEFPLFRIEKSKAVLRHIEKLRSLQDFPVFLSFEQINSWRQELDDSRAKHFDAALEEIDKD